MTQDQHIDRLIDETNKILNKAILLKEEDLDTLNYKPSPNKWSALECIEHLNLYGDFYLPEIEKQMAEAKPTQKNNYKSGVLGNYLVQSMLPKGGTVKKMKTFKDKDPGGSQLSLASIDRFIEQQKHLIQLLRQSKQLDTMKVKTKTTIPLIRLRLGDTFHFVVNHHIRHWLQLEKAIQSKHEHYDQ